MLNDVIAVKRSGSYIVIDSFGNEFTERWVSITHCLGRSKEVYRSHKDTQEIMQQRGVRK